MEQYFKKICDYTEKNRIQAKEICKATGISEANYCNWKKGKSEPRLSDAIAIMNYLKLPLSWLQDEKAPPDKGSLEERIEKIEKMLNVS